jgi:hypothetical protein
MKHVYRSFAFFCAFILSFSSKAQNYTISPANTVYFTAEYNTLTINDIYMVNNANTKISLSWTLISNNLVAGWDYAICDLGTCYPGIPPSATMDSVEVGAMGFLGLNVNPYSIPGTGSVTVYVYETQYPSNGDTLTWYVTSSPSGVNENSKALSMNVYPNPASEVINVDLGGHADEAEFISIYNILGEKVLRRQLSGSTIQLELGALASGIYVLAAEDAHGRTIVSKKITRN